MFCTEEEMCQELRNYSYIDFSKYESFIKFDCYLFLQFFNIVSLSFAGSFEHLGNLFFTSF